MVTSKLDMTPCQWLSMLMFSPKVIVIVVMIRLLQGGSSSYEGGRSEVSMLFRWLFIIVTVVLATIFEY